MHYWFHDILSSVVIKARVHGQCALWRGANSLELCLPFFPSLFLPRLSWKATTENKEILSVTGLFDISQSDNENSHWLDLQREHETHPVTTFWWHQLSLQWATYLPSDRKFKYSQLCLWPGNKEWLPAGIKLTNGHDSVEVRHLVVILGQCLCYWFEMHKIRHSNSKHSRFHFPVIKPSNTIKNQRFYNIVEIWTIFGMSLYPLFSVF